MAAIILQFHQQTQSKELDSDEFCLFPKNRWYLSKNNNFYNPVFKITVYYSAGMWRMARNGLHTGHYPSLDEAKEEAHQIWLRER